MQKGRKPSTEKYIGRVYELNSGISVKVVEYKGYHGVMVVTLDKYADYIRCEISQLTKGTLKTPHEVVVAGVGYIGRGQYKPRPKGGPKSKAYVYWSNMLTRAYRGNYPSYDSVDVDPRWHNFQIFAEWFYSQYGHDIGWELDKDLIGTGFLYSPECCVLVPSVLNSFAAGIYKDNGCLAGVHLTRSGMYRAQLSNNVTEKREVLGSYVSELDAFRAYKNRKEQNLKELLLSEKCSCVPAELAEKLLSGFSVEEVRATQAEDIGG